MLGAQRRKPTPRGRPSLIWKCRELLQVEHCPVVLQAGGVKIRDIVKMPRIDAINLGEVVGHWSEVYPLQLIFHGTTCFICIRQVDFPKPIQNEFVFFHGQITAFTSLIAAA